MDLPAGTSTRLQGQDNSGVLWRHVLVVISAEVWPSGGPDLTPWSTKCGLFWRTRLGPKASQPGQSEEIPRARSCRNPHGDGACHNSRVARVSQGFRLGTGRAF